MIERFAPLVKSRLQKKPGRNTEGFFGKFTRKTMDKIQLSRLKKTIRYCYNTSPYYHKLFKENGIRPGDIRKLSDMTKIPFTKTEDLQNDPKSFFSVSEDQFIRVFTTSGTTGKPKKAYFTKEDLDKIVESTATGAKIMYDITSKDIIRLTFEVGYGTEIWGNRYCLSRAYESLGALIIATGRLSVNEELEMIREYKPNIFGDVSSRVYYLTKEMSKLCDLKELGIKKFLIGAEPTPNAMRNEIEKAWDADVYIGYGITEIGLLMAGECEKKQGMHLSEFNFLTEVVDPETGEQLEDGEVGELLFTTYDRKGMPLIRYNSHDLGRIIPEICSCGLPLKRIEIKGRSDDLIPIGAGDNLFTRMFDEAIFSIPEILEYQVIFDKKDGKDLITIIAESSVIDNSIRNKIIDAILNMPEIKNGVEQSKTIEVPVAKLVKPNTFDRNSIKTRRLIDKRNLYD